MLHRLVIGARTGKRLLICLLLGLYVSGMYGYNFFHTILHSHEHAVSHTAEAEEDPCHRTLYHQDQQNGCAHQSHVSVDNECTLCDIIAPADVATLRVFTFESHVISDRDNTAVATGSLDRGNSARSSRAPPSV